MRHKIKHTDNFADKLERFPKELQDIILGAVKKLGNNPGYPSLHTKRVQGQIGLFESRANKDIRFFWQYDGEKIILTDVGRHDVLKNY